MNLQLFGIIGILVVAGYFIEEDRATAFLVMALALYMVSGALGPIWVIGDFLTDILGSLSSLANAAACTVIVVGIYNRLKP